MGSTFWVSGAGAAGRGSGPRWRVTGRQPGSAAGAGAWQVTVDGRPLHLMRRADGSYMSMVDHYTSYDSPLAAAKAAVDELGDQQLRPHEGEM